MHSESDSRIQYIFRYFEEEGEGGVVGYKESEEEVQDDL